MASQRTKILIAMVYSHNTDTLVWKTLRQIREELHIPEASASRRLRELKTKGWVLHKNRNPNNEWSYALSSSNIEEEKSV